jgi:hypothetical protein
MIEKNRNCNFPSHVSTDMRYDLAVEREMETFCIKLPQMIFKYQSHFNGKLFVIYICSILKYLTRKHISFHLYLDGNCAINYVV